MVLGSVYPTAEICTLDNKRGFYQSFPKSTAGVFRGDILGPNRLWLSRMVKGPFGQWLRTHAQCHPGEHMGSLGVNQASVVELFVCWFSEPKKIKGKMACSRQASFLEFSSGKPFVFLLSAPL